jgi:5-methylcytosine-specific restriction endonuclease McrA
MPELKVCNACGTLHDDIGSPVCAKCYRPRVKRPMQIQRDRLYGSARWRKVRLAVLDRDDHACRRCGGTHGLIVHHDLEAYSGHDPLDADNLETLCRACHAREHNARRAHARSGRDSIGGPSL